MFTRHKDRNLRRSIGASVRPGTYRRDPIATALIKIAAVRYQAFRDYFGRDPLPDEPLFFDPSREKPTACATAEMRAQLITAASTTKSDSSSLSKFFGLDALEQRVTNGLAQVIDDLTATGRTTRSSVARNND